MPNTESTTLDAESRARVIVRIHQLRATLLSQTGQRAAVTQRRLDAACAFASLAGITEDELRDAA